MSFLRTITIVSFSVVPAVAALIGVYLQYFSDSSLHSLLCPQASLSGADNSHSGYFTYERAGKPHHSSWTSWWHPQRSDGTLTEHKQGAGAITDDWNILYHLGGNGPWVEKLIDVVNGGIAAPASCQVEQVHMMSRHAERYPTVKAGNGQEAVVQRMKQSGKIFDGNLAFFNNWTLFWSSDDSLEQLTSTGPFSGTLGSFTTGVRLRTRYTHLLDKAFASHRPTTFWASDSQRVMDTARLFGLGFFGMDYTNNNTALLEVIPEDSSQAANTLTPGRTCLNNKKDMKEGQKKGYDLHAAYIESYVSPIRARLLAQTGMEFGAKEIYHMQEMCGFETTVRGYSDWCDVFTQDEFLSFEYARDILHYYRAGPGQKYAASMGWLWLNATTNLLLEGPDAGPLFFSFVHDGDIAPMITALDVINDEEHLPVTHINHERKWRKSQVCPMGGRIILELLSCAREDKRGEERFVRLSINDGITALPDCQSGPGKSCPLEQFATRTRRKGNEAGDFRKLCGMNEDQADRITFLHQRGVLNR